MTEIKIQPLSVNACFQGRRFKTPAYTSYERSCLFLLPKKDIPLGKLKISFEFGLSYSGNDIDNSIKPFLDILQKKYGFNDSRIYELNVKKIKTQKGQEFIRFEIENLEK